MVGFNRAVRARGRLACLLALSLALSVWLVCVVIATPFAAAHSFDFNSYYAAAQALRYDHSANIYDLSVLNQTERAHGLCVHAGHIIPPFLYPSIFAILFQPMTLLPCGVAATLWLLVNAALWIGSALLLADVLARRWPGRRLLATTLMVFASFASMPAYYGLFIGQIHLLLLFGTALTLWLAERDRLWLAGGVLGLITALKLLPVVLIGYYLLRGRYRVVVASVIVGVAALAVMLLYSGLATLVANLTALLSISVGSLRWYANESLRATVPVVGDVLAGLAVVATLAALVRRRGDELLGAAWALCVMLLISPLVWGHYIIWVTIPLCACLTAIGPLGRANRLLWTALVVIFLVTSLPLQGAWHPLATLALWGILGALYWRTGAPIAATTLARNGEAAPASVS
jgi:hypothetical protein